MDMRAVVQALRDRAKKMVSLDSPANADLVDTGADIAAGFAPVVGTALSARDFERARREGDKLGMGLAAAGMIPVVGGASRAASKALRKAPRDEALETARQNAVKMLGLPENNTAIDRARAMGFIHPLYRGSMSNEKKHTKVIWVADTPDASNYYAGYVNQDELYPMLSRHEGGNLMPLLGHSDWVHADNASPLWNGGLRYQLPPEAIRSRFAAFDPARINEKDIMGSADPRLLAAIAGGGAVGLTIDALRNKKEEEKNRR